MMMHSLLLLVLSTVLLLGSSSSAFAPTAFVSNSNRNVDLKAAESEVSFDKLDGSSVRIGIIHSRWNTKYVDSLVDGAKKALQECNVEEDNTFITSVPGSFELPLAARLLALSGTVDAIICVGVLIKGETSHFEYISEAVSSGIMSVSLQTTTPITFGVLTCLNEDQVKKRSTDPNNHGYDWGKTAVEMALLRKEALGSAKKGSKLLESIGFQSGSSSAEKKEGEKEKVPGFF